MRKTIAMLLLTVAIVMTGLSPVTAFAADASEEALVFENTETVQTEDVVESIGVPPLDEPQLGEPPLKEAQPEIGEPPLEEGPTAEPICNEIEPLGATSQIVFQFGTLEVRYSGIVEYTGRAIKADDLHVKITHLNTHKVYTPDKVTYTNNKNVGYASFRIKTVKNLSDNERWVQKTLAATTLPFCIDKMTLTSAKAEVKVNKNNAVVSVKALLTDNKGKTKKVTLAKKDWVISDGYVVVKGSCKSFTGSFKYY